MTRSIRSPSGRVTTQDIHPSTPDHVRNLVPAQIEGADVWEVESDPGELA